MPSKHAAPPKHIAIVGGGITGLTAAYEFVKAGYLEPGSGYTMTVYEADERLGGKLETAYLPLDAKEDEKKYVVNKGAEFIDTHNTGLRSICDDFGINLIEATDQKTRKFGLEDGTVMEAEDFFRECKPIYAQINLDKQKVTADKTDEKSEEFRKHLNNITLKKYLEEICDRIQDKELKKKLKTFIPTIAGAFIADNGQEDVYFAK
jgi:monoamine oxidase